MTYSQGEMENISRLATILELLWIKELEGYTFLYASLFFALYLSILVMSFMIAFVVFTEESLHKPMYIFICNLALNGIFGCSSFFPKLILDLLTSSNSISYSGCLTQIYCILCFTCFEITTFTLMAFDRFLAVCYPLHYATLMTNEKTLKLIIGFLVGILVGVLTILLLSARLRLCGREIQNVFCDNPSIVLLACADTLVNNLYGTTVMVIFSVTTSSFIGYTYLRIFMVCVKVSKIGNNKAIHTLVTHLLNYSIFLTGFLFSFIRYRINTTDVPLPIHVLLSISRFVFPPFLNPLIYGMRTKALKDKIAQRLSKARLQTFVFDK